jgi:mannose-1-phosphate guanylyltransferase
MMTEHYENYYAVIMAGGGGTRLWPISRRSHPKQMMELEKDRSLFQIAVDRLEGLFPPERIFVVTVEDQAVGLKKICPQIPRENFLIEPFPKGTASVVGLAAIVLEHIRKDATMVILTADHFIENVSGFQHVLRAGFEVSQANQLVTLGIEPTFASTGYGYIQRGEFFGNFQGLDVYSVNQFTEKPRLEVAEKYIQGGNHFWNSGMFIWRTEEILKEFVCQMPDLYSILLEIKTHLAEEGWNDDITEFWSKIHPQTIDYGIMEHAQDVVVIPAGNLGWNDVGAWDSLHEVLQRDREGNIIHHPNHIGLETKNTIIFSKESERLIVTIGINDLVIIETEDALLICPREEVQRVKEIVNQLKEEKREKYL